jgi:hypothetical protein
MRTIIPAIAAVLLHLPGYSDAQPVTPESDWSLLLQGEVLLEKIEDKTGLPGIRASFTMPASRYELWGMLTDYENFSRIYGGIDSLRVLSECDTGALVEFFQDVRIKKINFVLQRNYLEKGYRLTWYRVSGDMKYIQGSWDILDTPDPESRLVIYTSFFKYGGIIPARLTRNWACGEVRAMAENARSWIRENRKLYLDIP